MLRLRQDDDEVEAAREDEPFVTGPLGETTLLREVFFDALGHDWPGRRPRDDFERLYTMHAESRIRRGLIPIGLFGEAERRRHLACLANWNESARQQRPRWPARFPGLSLRACQRRRAGRPHREPDHPRCPRAAGDRGRFVSSFMAAPSWSLDELPASITPVVQRTSPREKDFLAGFLDAVVLSLLPGHQGPDEYHAHVIAGGDGADPSKVAPRVPRDRSSRKPESF